MNARNATTRTTIEVVASGHRMAKYPAAIAARHATARHAGVASNEPTRSRSVARRVRICPVPACAAAKASTVPIVMATLACTLMRCVALQNTARSAVRSRMSPPRLDARLTPTESRAKWTTPVTTRPNPITSNARRLSRARRTAIAKQASAPTVNGIANQPASEETRIVVSTGVLWETPTAMLRTPSGSAVRELRVGRREAVADELGGVVDVHQQPAASTLDDRRVQLAHAGVEHALERLGRHEVGDDRLDEGPRRDRDAATWSPAARGRRRSGGRLPRAPPAP